MRKKAEVNINLSLKETASEEDKSTKEKFKKKVSKEAEKTYKCFSCKNIFPETELEYIGKRKYCAECVNKKKKEDEEKEAKTDSNSNDYKALINCIFQLYGYKNNDARIGMIVRQIKNFLEENPGVSYRGMRLTIRYYHEILGFPVNPERGVFRPLCFYYEAQKYQMQKYANIQGARDNPEKIEEMLSTETVIVDLKAKEKYNEIMENRWKNSFHDLEEIVPDEDDIITDKNQELIDLLNSEYPDIFSFDSINKKKPEDEEREAMEGLV